VAGLPLFLAAAILAGCPAPPDRPPPSLAGPCQDWTDAHGEVTCVHAVPDLATWERIAMPSEAADKRVVTKHSVPTDPDDPIPTLFVNANDFALHYDFLRYMFGDLLPGLTQYQYAEMVLDPENRRFYTGNVAEFIEADGGSIYGFTVWDDGRFPSRALTYADALFVWQELQPRFSLGDLVFVPNSAGQRAAVPDWPDGPFKVRGEDRITYEAYTLGEAYGTVRFVDVQDLDVATRDGLFGWQDILVLDQAPFDVERVVAAAVTGTRQGELSHLNVRSAARGSPNCFVAAPYEALARFEGRLVRFTCGADRFTVEPADLADAEAWWERFRPDPVPIRPADRGPNPLIGLLDLPTASAAERGAGTAAYGSKGTNLAVLYQRIPSAFQLQGFAVPMQHYDAFVTGQGYEVDLGDGPAWHSFAEVIDAWHAEPDFLSDVTVRRARLLSLRDAMRAATPDPELVDALHARIVADFGSDTVMVRFRSSSNAEDALAFSGAGIYDSTSVCAADSVDADQAGPSRCDPDQGSERTIERGLVRVWSSLWNPEAWEERSWWGIDHAEAAMGVLVNTRSADERANIVAFSGDPSRPDDRTLVNAQIGELDVVSAEPGVYPEQTRLTIDGGLVVDIERIRPSSEVRTGQEVLSDAQLRELGRVFAKVVADVPIDEPTPSGRTVLLDSEWKVLEDGRLVIKQWRPFLR
jgi:hypothetical protein